MARASAQITAHARLAVNSKCWDTEVGHVHVHVKCCLCSLHTARMHRCTWQLSTSVCLQLAVVAVCMQGLIFPGGACLAVLLPLHRMPHLPGPTAGSRGHPTGHSVSSALLGGGGWCQSLVLSYICMVCTLAKCRLSRLRLVSNLTGL